MSTRQEFCPEWAWWVRSGERLALGIHIRTVLESTGSTTKANREGLTRAMEEVFQGRGVTEAFRAAGLVLPVEGWSLFEAGEVAGRLGEAMIETGQFLKEQQKRRSEFLGQLWYPALVVVTGMLVMGIILLWVVPQMREMSSSMGMGNDVPWFTENIGRIYGAVLGLLVLIISGSLSGFFLLCRLGKRSLKWALAGERLLQSLPLAGWLRCTRREARITRQLGTLLRGGVTLPKALEMAASAAPDQWEYQQLEDFRTRLVMGSGFAEALEAFPIIQAESGFLLMAGQESGHLDRYLVQVSDDLAGQARRQLATWIRFLEPVMLLLLSAAIGGLILAYLLPMVGMLEQLA